MLRDIGSDAALSLSAANMDLFRRVFARKDQYEASLRRAETKLAAYELKLGKELRQWEAIAAKRGKELDRVRDECRHRLQLLYNWAVTGLLEVFYKQAVLLMKRSWLRSVADAGSAQALQLQIQATQAWRRHLLSIADERAQANASGRPLPLPSLQRTQWKGGGKDKDKDEDVESLLPLDVTAFCIAPEEVVAGYPVVKKLNKRILKITEALSEIEADVKALQPALKPLPRDIRRAALLELVNREAEAEVADAAGDGETRDAIDVMRQAINGWAAQVNLSSNSLADAAVVPVLHPCAPWAALLLRAHADSLLRSHPSDDHHHAAVGAMVVSSAPIPANPAMPPRPPKGSIYYDQQVKQASSAAGSGSVVATSAVAYAATADLQQAAAEQQQAPSPAILPAPARNRLLSLSLAPFGNKRQSSREGTVTAGVAVALNDGNNSPNPFPASAASNSSNGAGVTRPRGPSAGGAAAGSHTQMSPLEAVAADLGTSWSSSAGPGIGVRSRAGTAASVASGIAASQFLQSIGSNSPTTCLTGMVAVIGRLLLHGMPPIPSASATPAASASVGAGASHVSLLLNAGSGSLTTLLIQRLVELQQVVEGVAGRQRSKGSRSREFAKIVADQRSKEGRLLQRWCQKTLANGLEGQWQYAYDLPRFFTFDPGPAFAAQTKGLLGIKSDSRLVEPAQQQLVLADGIDGVSLYAAPAAAVGGVSLQPQANASVVTESTYSANKQPSPAVTDYSFNSNLAAVGSSSTGARTPNADASASFRITRKQSGRSAQLPSSSQPQQQQRHASSRPSGGFPPSRVVSAFLGHYTRELATIHSVSAMSDGDATSSDRETMRVLRLLVDRLLHARLHAHVYAGIDVVPDTSGGSKRHSKRRSKDLSGGGQQADGGNASVTADAAPNAIASPAKSTSSSTSMRGQPTGDNGLLLSPVPAPPPSRYNTASTPARGVGSSIPTTSTGLPAPEPVGSASTGDGAAPGAPLRPRGSAADVMLRLDQIWSRKQRVAAGMTATEIGVQPLFAHAMPCDVVDVAASVSNPSAAAAVPFAIPSALLSALDLIVSPLEMLQYVVAAVDAAAAEAKARAEAGVAAAEAEALMTNAGPAAQLAGISTEAAATPAQRKPPKVPDVTGDDLVPLLVYVASRSSWTRPHASMSMMKRYGLPPSGAGGKEGFCLTFLETAVMWICKNKQAPAAAAGAGTGGSGIASQVAGAAAASIKGSPAFGPIRGQTPNLRAASATVSHTVDVTLLAQNANGSSLANADLVDDDVADSVVGIAHFTGISSDAAIASMPSAADTGEYTYSGGHIHVSGVGTGVITSAAVAAGDSDANANAYAFSDDDEAGEEEEDEADVDGDVEYDEDGEEYDGLVDDDDMDIFGGGGAGGKDREFGAGAGSSPARDAAASARRGDGEAGQRTSVREMNNLKSLIADQDVLEGALDMFA